VPFHCGGGVNHLIYNSGQRCGDALNVRQNQFNKVYRAKTPSGKEIQKSPFIPL